MCGHKHKIEVFNVDTNERLDVFETDDDTFTFRGLYPGVRARVYDNGMVLSQALGSKKRVTNNKRVQTSKGRSYCGVSREKALKDFKPNDSNPTPINDCGIRGKDYDYVDSEGVVVGGWYCYEIDVDVQSKYNYSEPQVKNEDGEIEVVYNMEYTVTITLKHNEIFYLRENDPLPGDANHLITKDESEKMYLHERGHQECNWSIVPKRGKVIKLAFKNEKFSGRSVSEVHEKANSWRMEKKKLLKDEYIERTNEELNKARDKYHDDYTRTGNPWE